MAIERVSGALDGRRGTFVLQHTGAMRLDLSGGQHAYVLEYTLGGAN